MKKFRLLTTGGGTGGHVYPISAVVAEVQTFASAEQKNLEVRYMGYYGSFRTYLEQNNIKVHKIAKSKLRRYFSIMNFIDVPKFIWSVFQAIFKMYWYMPDVVFSTGGTSSFPVILAARFYRIPVIAHEFDSLPSLNTRLASRFAEVITTSFQVATESIKTKGEVVYVGYPIRRYILSDPVTQTKAKGYFGFNVEEPLLVVLGGSQGAAAVNDFIIDVIPSLVEMTQVLHVTGAANYDKVTSEAAVVVEDLPGEVKNKYKPIDYLEKDMRIALQGADLIVSRSGAGGIFEAAAFKRPAILIPLSSDVTTRQQESNAIEASKSGGVIVMEQNNLLPNLFLGNVKSIIEDPQKKMQMGEAIGALHRPDAASNLARIILRYS